MPDNKARDIDMFKPAKSNAERYLFNQRGFGSHQAILELVDPESRVLDVGAATGRLALELQGRRSADVVGIEQDPTACAAMRRAGLQVVEGDIVAEGALEPLLTKENGFDIIICGDILEHLVDPQRTILALKRLLRPKGYFIISIPNVVSLRARWSIARGKWRYTEAGIFDKTHLRFFTPATARELLSDSGLDVIRAIPVGPLTVRFGKWGLLPSRIWPSLLATQVVFKARVDLS